jgi:hypothetical protein
VVKLSCPAAVAQVPMQLSLTFSYSLTVLALDQDAFLVEGHHVDALLYNSCGQAGNFASHPNLSLAIIHNCFPDLHVEIWDLLDDGLVVCQECLPAGYSFVVLVLDNDIW